MIWCGRVMLWCYGGVVVWWCDVVMLWRCGDAVIKVR